MRALDNIKDQIDILDYLKANISTKIQRVGKNHAELNPCPICGHNDCFRVYLETNSWNCHSTDHETDGGDLIQFIKEHEGVKFHEAKNILEDFAQSNGKSEVDDQTETVVAFDKTKENSEQEKKDDFSFLIEKFHANVNDTSYYENRGISDRLIDKYKLGYDHEHNAAVLPCYKDGDPVFITKRFIDPTDYKYFNKGQIHFFNSKLLDSNKEVIFVTEGIFDALSIEEVTNEPALALNSSNNVSDFLKTISHNNINKQFILIADNDPAGQKAIEEFSHNSQCSGYCLDKYDDPNEYLQNGVACFFHKAGRGNFDKPALCLF